jgi:hypothetical protein
MLPQRDTGTSTVRTGLSSTRAFPICLPESRDCPPGGPGQMLAAHQLRNKQNVADHEKDSRAALRLPRILRLQSTHRADWRREFTP